jgi:CheY-like chemotaxis protein
MARLRLMLIEDDLDLRDLLGTALEDKYEVVAPSNGLDGLNLIQLVDPDLVIVDGMMPVMNGRDFTVRLREMEWRIQPRSATERKMPIIFISARNDDASIKAAMERGVNKYLVKPMSRDSLLDAVHEEVANHGLTAKIKAYPVREFRDVGKPPGKEPRPEIRSEPGNIRGLVNPIPGTMPVVSPGSGTAGEAAADNNEKTFIDATRKPMGPRPTSGPAGESESPVRQSRVLVVDDDQDLVELVEMELSKSFVVRTAPDGLKALAGMIEQQLA